MIVVTGASGKLGRRIVEKLLERTSPNEIAATARDPGKAADLGRAGVRVRHGDFAKPESLASAFEGASQVLIVSSNAEAYGGDSHAQHRAAFAAARKAGARRIVYTSHMGVGRSSAFRPMHNHAAAEDMLREVGIPWTALRNGFYAATVPGMMLGDAMSTGVIAAPADGKVSWTTHEDLATAAAIILSEEGRFDGPTPPLTASEALDLADVAAMLTDIGGRKIERRVVSDEDQAAGMRAAGLPPVVIDIASGMYRAARAGEFAAVDPTLATLIGREPIPLRDVLAKSL